MAKLYFTFAAMNAGKSTVLLQASHNYRERGMNTLLLTARHDDRAGPALIASRIGLQSEAEVFDEKTDLERMIGAQIACGPVACVLVDEAQFLTHDQVWQLARATDAFNVPVMCYGLRTDFRGELFEGSATLLAIADVIRELRTICWCGSKATMVLRLDEAGQPVLEGDQVEIGGNERYVSVCRRHWSARAPRAQSE